MNHVDILGVAVLELLKDSHLFTEVSDSVILVEGILLVVDLICVDNLDSDEFTGIPVFAFIYSTKGTLANKFDEVKWRNLGVCAFAVATNQLGHVFGILNSFLLLFARLRRLRRQA